VTVGQMGLRPRSLAISPACQARSGSVHMSWSVRSHLPRGARPGRTRCGDLHQRPGTLSGRRRLLRPGTSDKGSLAVRTSRTGRALHFAFPDQESNRPGAGRTGHRGRRRGGPGGGRRGCGRSAKPRGFFEENAIGYVFAVVVNFSLPTSVGPIRVAPPAGFVKAAPLVDHSFGGTTLAGTAR